MTGITDENLVHTGMLHEHLELLVHRIIHDVDGEQLAELKREFHNRLRITQDPTDNTDIIEDIWDYFYDWCVFEQALPDTMSSLTEEERLIWEKMKTGNHRSLFSVTRANDSALKLKDLYGRGTFVVKKRSARDFLGLSRGDMIEGRLIEGEPAGRKVEYVFVRKPSYHPQEIHGYVKKKVREFRKAKDDAAMRHWLWVLVGMDLKHRFYPQMPVDRIYDDNSRI